LSSFAAAVAITIARSCSPKAAAAIEASGRLAAFAARYGFIVVSAPSKHLFAD
jgi:hypothetical protein